MTYTEKTMIKRLFWLVAAAALGLAIGSASAQTYFAPPEPLSCTQGSVKAITTGLSSTNSLQSSFPSCTVAVYLHGTSVLATIFSNSTGTSLSNPFTAPSNGLFLFYAAFGEYDVTLSATGMTTTTLADVTISAPFNGITGVFGGSPGIPFALTGSTSRAATSTDLATLGAIVSGANCGGALSGTFPNCTIAGIGSAGSIPMSDGAGHLEPATSADLATLGAIVSGANCGGALSGTFPNCTIGGIGAAGLIPASDGAGNLVPATDAQKTITLGITPLILGGTKTAVDGMTSLTFGTSDSTGFTSIGQGEATIDSFSIFPIGLTLTGFSTFGTHATIVDRNLGNTWYFGVDGTNQLASEGNYVITNDPMWDTNQFEVGASGIFLPYISSGLCLQTTGSHGQIVGAACGGTVGVPVDVTGSRTFGPGNIYQNTNAYTLQASGFGVAVTGTATNNIACLIGPTSPPTMIVFSETNGATTIGGAAGFICPRIPATWFYEVNKTNDLSATPSSWIESPTI